MTHYTRACMLAAIPCLALVLPGCGTDNEKAAKIEGTVPTDSLSDQERKQKSAGSNKEDMTKAGYNPSANNRRPGSGGGGGNNRTQ